MAAAKISAMTIFHLAMKTPVIIRAHWREFNR
jgi:hypothetical protein